MNYNGRDVLDIAKDNVKLLDGYTSPVINDLKTRVQDLGSYLPETNFPTLTSASTSTTDSFDSFQSSKIINGTKEFLESNSIISRLAFLLMLVFIFIILLRIGIYIISKIMGPSEYPTLINGMINSKEMLIIPQNPNIKNSIEIQRSSNKTGGIEFTWSTWIYIDNLTYKEGQYRHIFHKGNDSINMTSEPKGLNFPNNAPGLYLAPNTNSIIVIMNTFKNITEEITIDNIPIKKWVNIIIRNNGNILDIFINGSLSRRHILQSVAKQNYGDVYVSMNGGFDGYTSALKYYSKAIGTREIQKIISNGPNLKLKSDDINKSKPQYLSLRWYFMGNEDSYNP
jgi:hypothetical protein